MALTDAQPIKQRASVLASVSSDFCSWMRSYPEIVENRKDSLNKIFWQYHRQAKLIERAAGRPVNIGVFGASQAGKSYLISALTRDPTSGRCLGLFGGRTMDFLNEMNPPGGEESTGIVSRFTVTLPTNTDAKYPIRMQILRRIEILKILINAYLSDIDMERELQLTEKAVDDWLNQYPNEQEQNLEPDPDFYELEEYLDAHFANTITAKILKPYWKRLGIAAAGLDDSAYVKFCSIFWQNTPDFNHLFERLCSTLETLGHPEYLSANIAALDKNQSGGRNVLYASALQDIITGAGYPIPVRLDNGQTADVDLAVLAGLLIEITVPLPSKPDPIFAHTDLLDFPGARSRLNLRTRQPNGDAFTAEQFNALIKDNLATLFKRGKVDYLYQKYVDENEFTAMLLCMGDGPQEVKTILNMIERWLEYTHGSTPEERARCATALFMVLTKMDLHLEHADPNAIGEIWRNRINSSLIEPYGSSEGNWFNEWTPGCAFNNSYWLRNPNIRQSLFTRDEQNETGISADARTHLDEFKRSFSQAESAKKHFANPEEAFEAALVPGDGGVSYILKHLSQISRPQLKIDQLRMQVEKLARSMLQKMSEFYKDGDFSKVLAQRIQQNKPVMQALLFIRDMERFGALLQAMMLSEHTVAAVIKELRFTEEDEHVVEEAIIDEDQEWINDMLGVFALNEEDSKRDDAPPATIDANRRLAEHLLNEWTGQMYDLGKNPKAQRFFQLSEANFSTFLNEIIIGSTAARLSDALSALTAEIKRFPHREQNIIPHLSRQLAGTLNHYINFLDLDGRGHTARVHGQKDVYEPLFNRDNLPVGATPSLPENGSHKDHNYCTHWLRAYGIRVQENVRYETDTADLNTEANSLLGSLLERINTPA